MAFKVKKIIDGDTIQVSPGWNWDDHSGFLVRVLGYSAVNEQNKLFAMSKLKILLADGAPIELKNAKKVAILEPHLAETLSLVDSNVLYCSVYLNEVDIAQYFPELKHPTT